MVSPFSLSTVSLITVLVLAATSSPDVTSSSVVPDNQVGRSLRVLHLRKCHVPQFPHPLPPKLVAHRPRHQLVIQPVPVVFLLVTADVIVAKSAAVVEIGRGLERQIEKANEAGLTTAGSGRVGHGRNDWRVE